MPTQFSKKKRCRQFRIRKHIERDFDYSSFKAQINKEMSNFRNKSSNCLSFPINSDYTKLFKHYSLENFTLSTVMLLNRMFYESKQLPKELRNNFSLHSLVIKVVKQLMMNELEIVYFSLYLDKFGWKNENFDLFEYFIIAALKVKKILNREVGSIEFFINMKYPYLILKYNNLYKENEDPNRLNEISPFDLNERFNLLKRPYNAYCKSNFIDYNESVDRILKMSIPYSDSSKSRNSKRKKQKANSTAKSKKNTLILIPKDKKDVESIAEDNKDNGVDNKKEITLETEHKYNLVKEKKIKNQSDKYSYNDMNTINQVNQSTNNGQSFLFTQPSNTLMNYVPDNTSVSNYNQIFNFNQPNPPMNEFLTNQQSEMTINPIGLGRNASAFDHSLFQRNSQFSDRNEEFQDPFFKQFELKPNISMVSLFGEGNMQEEDKSKNVISNQTMTMSLKPKDEQKGKKNLLALYQKLKTSQNKDS